MKIYSLVILVLSLFIFASVKIQAKSSSKSKGSKVLNPKESTTKSIQQNEIEKPLKRTKRDKNEILNDEDDYLSGETISRDFFSIKKQGSHVFKLWKKQFFNLRFGQILSMMFSWDGFVLLFKFSIAFLIYGIVIKGIMLLCFCCFGVAAASVLKRNMQAANQHSQ